MTAGDPAAVLPLVAFELCEDLLLLGLQLEVDQWVFSHGEAHVRKFLRSTATHSVFWAIMVQAVLSVYQARMSRGEAHVRKLLRSTATVSSGLYGARHAECVSSHDVWQGKAGKRINKAHMPRTYLTFITFIGFYKVRCK